MNTLTKLALGLMGRLKTEPSESAVPLAIVSLPTPTMPSGLPVMEALQQRHSERDFLPAALESQLLSNLLWAACGINRPESGGRTAPSAMNAQEVDVYLAMPQGLYLYDPQQHVLKLTIAKDVRRVTGYQDFVATAPLDLIFVADHARMKLVPASKRESYASVSAGAIAQNVALFCVSFGLVSVIRGWFDRGALTQAMDLRAHQQLLLLQTLGYPKPPTPTIH